MKPFLKWAGGKRRLLKHIAPLIPMYTGSYREPFVGGGALFFCLGDHSVVSYLSDNNPVLMKAYRGLRDDVEEVIRAIRFYEMAGKMCGHELNFYEVRSLFKDLDSKSPEQVAAWLIYMNRTGFNGLYRVNKKGEFNTPWGKREFSFDPEVLRSASKALRKANLSTLDFEESIDSAEPGDFAYCDPPYDGTYTSYTAGGFTAKDQGRLSWAVFRAKKRGVNVMVSNADTPLIRELYRGFQITTVSAPRSIAADGSRRQRAAELIIQ